MPKKTFLLEQITETLRWLHFPYFGRRFWEDRREG